MQQKGFDPSSAREFVSTLMSEASSKPITNTGKNCPEIPEYFDKEKYRRGQKFYQENIFGIFYGKLLGLMTLFTTEHTNQVLIMTEKSSTPATAYQRYMRTILHMNSWYCEEFKPGSRPFASLLQVNRTHYSTSGICQQKGMPPITQFDMVSTQFGFMGYIALRYNRIGVPHATEEDLEGFVHFWRVIGHALGIEDRYNLCRDTLKETQEICEELFTRKFLPKLTDLRPDYILLSDALIGGMDVVNPVLSPQVFHALLLDIAPKNKQKNIMKEKLNYRRWILCYIITLVVFLLRFKLVRQVFNFLQNLALWCAMHFPFLAYLKYGPKYCPAVPNCLKQ